MGKNFQTFSEVEKRFQALHREIRNSLLNAIEVPLTTADYQVLGYPSRKALQNDLSRIPNHKVNGKIFIYLSEYNNFIKNSKSSEQEGS